MRDIRLFDHSDKGANLQSLQENSREGGARCWTPPPSDTAADRVSLEREVWSRALVRSVARKVTGWDDGEGFEMGRGKKFFFGKADEEKEGGRKRYKYGGADVAHFSTSS